MSVALFCLAWLAFLLALLGIFRQGASSDHLQPKDKDQCKH